METSFTISFHEQQNPIKKKSSTLNVSYPLSLILLTINLVH